MTVAEGYRELLGHLAANFAAWIGRGVDVDVVLAGHQVGCLRVRQCGTAFDRARARVRDRNGDGGILAGIGGTVKMRGGRGAGKPRISQLPGQLLGGGIIVDVGSALAGARIRRIFGLGIEGCLHLLGERGTSECDADGERGEQGLGRVHVSLQVDVKWGTA
jgi:hypothetical protein